MLSEENKIIQKIPNLSSGEVKNIHLFINEALLFNNKHNIFVRDGFDDVLNKVNPQSDAPQNNDTFAIQLNSPNQNKLETLGLII